MRVALLGDIALFGRCTSTDYFKEISDYLARFDFIVGNLETPFSAVKKKSGAKSAYISADLSTMDVLTLLHLNAVSLANNHMFDYGKEGYEMTKEVLAQKGIEWFGAEGKELYVEEDYHRLAFAGYCCYTSNPLQCVKSGGYGVNAYDLNEAKEFIKKNASEGYLPIIAVHAGLEHVNYPSIDHIRAARQLASVGQYVYYGHHPHVIQGVEMSDGSLIAHSLGNFCFDNVFSDTSGNVPLVKMTENNRKGILLELTIEGNKLMEWREQVILITESGVRVDNSQNQKLEEYNRILVECEHDITDYNAKRNEMLDSRSRERKAMRNLIWYLKRLRVRYVRLMLDMRKNARLYNESVKRFL